MLISAKPGDITFMPKKPQTRPKVKPKTKLKTQPEPVSITSRKSYWIILSFTMVIFGAAYGSFMHLAVAAIGVLLGSVLAIIGFAGYLKFNPSTMKTNERATFMFGGASIIGFGIWIAVTLLTGLVGLGSDVSSSIGVGFFMITTLIIFLLLGAVIGDIIGKDRDEIKVSLGKLRQKFIH